MVEEEDGELLFNGYRISVCNYEIALEMDGGDGCLTMYLMPPNFTVENG